MNDLSPHDNSFTHDGRQYDLAKVRVLTRSEPAFFLPISQLLWVLKWDTPDPERVKKAKFRYPLLVSKYKGKYCVVDGLHRLERYRQKKITAIPVKLVSDDILSKTLITDNDRQNSI
jgi:hypothetical protein